MPKELSDWFEPFRKGQGTGNPVPGSGSEPSIFAGKKSPPSLGLPIPGKPNISRPPSGTTPQKVVNKLNAGQEVRGILDGKKVTIGIIDLEKESVSRRAAAASPPNVKVIPAPLNVKTVLPTPKTPIPSKLPKIAGGGLVATLAGLLVSGESVVPESLGDKVGTGLLDELMDIKANQVMNDIRNELKKDVKPCPKPENLCRDSSRCGGRAASVRGKTTSYDPWWGGTEKHPVNEFGDKVKTIRFR